MGFWSNKHVLITGHTGFKGSWLSLWLQRLGANVIGYALKSPTTPNLFTKARVADGMISIEGDIRDENAFTEIVRKFNPQIVFHLAAQPLVRKSYNDPIHTFDVNIMGTVHVLNALRYSESVKVVVNVTSDKCYENREWPWGYREIDPLGGYDPYSSSKGCAEIITDSYRRSFYKEKGIHLASARAGNVIGGGDWSEDRLVPDIIRSCKERRSPLIRNPLAIRPWQHVLEPLRGYLNLAEMLWDKGELFAEAWNFGPSDEHVRNVGEVTRAIIELWGQGLSWVYDNSYQPYEAKLLKLDCSKAKVRLGWHSRLSLEETIEWTVNAYKHEAEGNDMRELVQSQIEAYERKELVM
ncbi:CDP-glucose 4,6-dehydratase [Paenibacillus tianmuensis]|uniref:CDP-glucose 4,6-dehydratase n=1 Tax=Paenibacillus tianmuensis TaxID=624147 RepID=A0A1G4RRB6_9BACL|nr:CDP-glucose 4,6-dehydratase [Paenibacillus tianmuensis]SCW58669.1 CDP-glucose 4,6-dehydratase [Paenibacillus tianmuensis]